VPADITPRQTEIAVPLADGATLEATLVVPDGEGQHPAVIVLHEMFGLTDDIRGVATRFAQHGYVAVAPNLFSHGNTYACLSRVLTDLFVRGARGRTIDDVLAARRYLAHRSDVEPTRIAVVGFCMGGSFALVAAVKGDVAAAAVNYGAVPKARTELDGVCPVVASFGAEDRIFGPQAKRLEEHLTALGVPHDVKLYEGVGHSFINEPAGAAAWMARLPSPMHVGHSEEEAEDAWARMLTFFAEHV
jgi:carboxymethylenebutenolidase